jgi:glycosyltransferase involved in cell wall biosynthesis
MLLADNDILFIRNEASKLREHISSNTAIKQLFFWNGVSLWDAVQSNLFFSLLNISRISRAVNLIVAGRPDEIVIFGGREFISSLWFPSSRLIGKILKCKNSKKGELTYRICVAKRKKVTYIGDKSRLHINESIARLFLSIGHFLDSILKWITTRSLQSKDQDEDHKPKAIFVLHGSYPTLTAVPVIKELQRSNKCNVLPVCLDRSAIRTLKDNGIPSRSWDNYRLMDSIKHYLISSIVFRRKFSALQTSHLIHQILRHKGILSQAQANVIEKDFEELLTDLLPKLAESTEVFKNILRLEKPNLIVLLDDCASFERTIAFVSRSRDIPTLVLPYGVGDLAKNFPNILLAVDKMAVFGKGGAAIQCRYRGISPTRLAVTGNPGLEYRFCAQKKTDFKSSQEQEKNILFTSHSKHVHPRLTDMGRYRVLAAFYQVASKYEDIRFTIKLHPNETSYIHNVLIRKYGLRNVTITKETDIYRLLQRCDLLVTSWDSTTAMEAMLFGKPVVMLNLTGRSEGVPYAETGAVIQVRSIDEISAAIEQALHDRTIRDRLAWGRKQFVTEFLNGMDGHAARRCADLIENEIGVWR